MHMGVVRHLLGLLVSNFGSESSSTDIDESSFLDAANQFVSLGLKDAGYEYVNIDVRSLLYPCFVRIADMLSLLLF